jgi:Lipase (class 3)
MGVAVKNAKQTMIKVKQSVDVERLKRAGDSIVKEVKRDGWKALPKAAKEAVSPSMPPSLPKAKSVHPNLLIGSPKIEKKLYGQAGGIQRAAVKPDSVKKNVETAVPGSVSANQTGKIQNAAHLAQYVFAGYNNGKFGPVSVTPATLTEGKSKKSVYVVGISGTEDVKGQSTRLLRNYAIGNEFENPAVKNARAIINTLPKGSTLILAGHSQGGMVAQLLALDAQLQKKYKISNTVTFGSALVGLDNKVTRKSGESLRNRAGRVERIVAETDPVAMMGTRALTDKEVFKRNLKDRTMIQSDHPGENFGFTAHLTDYTDEYNVGNQRLDALGRKDAPGQARATIEFDPKKRKFYSSPSNTLAP